MANFNLTSQQIKDTYQQLAQVGTGSLLVDGTGSAVSNLTITASHATFADNAVLPDGVVSSSAQLPQIEINSSSISTNTTAIATLELGSGSAEWSLISGIPEGLVSSSAQIATDISGAFTSTSASIATDVATNKVDISTNTSNISTNTSNISTNTSNIATLTGETSSYAKTNVNNTFTGLQTFNNIAVNGTASISVLQSVTGSAKIIGDAFIQLNTDTPSQRYAGLQVIDSGSTADTSSLIWDSETNDWFYEYEGDDPTDHGVLLFGPEYGTKGSPTYLTNNTIPKGDGGHHLNDSNITDDGTTVTVSTPLSASAVKLTSGGLTFSDGTTQTTLAQGGLVSGTGTDSMKSADSLTANPATASGNNTIAIGAGASATATNQIDIGGKFKYDGTDSIKLDSTNLLFNSNGTVGSGNVAINMGLEGGQVSGDYSANFGATYSNITSGDATVVGGYNHNISSGLRSAIFGGEGNTINGGDYSQIFGGASNTLASGDTSFIVGGYQNRVNAGARNGVIGGQSAISAHDFSVVIGRQSFTSTAAYTTYVANLETSGSITLGSEDIVNVSSGSATGSLIDNIHPAIASSSAQINHIVTLTQNQYTSLSGSGKVEDDTYYIVSDGNTNVWYNDLQVNGNLLVQGQISSPTFAGGIASSTSSIDFDNGNFATLNASSATFLANPTNLKSGTTYTLIVTNGANIAGYGTAWKFAGGTEPTLSANTDVITAVSDGSSLYAAALADFS